MAFNSLRHERLNSKSSFKLFAWVFQTRSPNISIDVDRKGIVHCVFDDKENNTKALAANDRSSAAPTIMQNYMRRQWWSLFDGTWPAHHITVWDAISWTMSAKYYARMLVSIRHNFSQCERAPICRQSCAGTNLCRITVAAGIAIWTRPNLSCMIALAQVLGSY